MWQSEIRTSTAPTDKARRKVWTTLSAGDAALGEGLAEPMSLCKASPGRCQDVRRSSVRSLNAIMRNGPANVKWRLPTRVSGCRSPGPVVELGDVERPCPLLADPREDLGLRREPLVEAIERAFLHVNDARTVPQVVGDHPGTAVGTEDPLQPLVRRCLGVRAYEKLLVLPLNTVKSASGT